MNVTGNQHKTTKADPAPAHRARAPLFENFSWCIFEIFDSKTRINFIVINRQCLQYVLYSLRSLQKHRICVKGHQNNLQTSKIIPRRDSAPVFKFLDPPLNHIFSVVDTFDLWMKCIKQQIIYMYILVQ